VSKVIHNPTLASVEEHTATSATFVVEPLHTGYGMTLGNSLRRVLLSSIAGSAIVAFKIEGVTHEFTTVPGVKEDVVDIMLNLKNVRFKLHSDQAQTIRLEKKGAGVVTAADIKVNADVEVVNPDAVIATIDDPKAILIMDIVVDGGRGYRTIEESSETRVHSDMIAVDALFSPVVRVRYKVENTRVGQSTDLDKLMLTVDTDGSITPKEAFEEAAAILVNQYTALAGSTEVQAGPAIGAKSPEDDEAAELMTPIEDLNLTARTTNALINNDIRTINDLVTLSESDLRELKGFGSKALDEVKEKLAELEF
jgi:DNA-directed RNA polymerase subunit alpha